MNSYMLRNQLAVENSWKNFYFGSSRNTLSSSLHPRQCVCVCGKERKIQKFLLTGIVHFLFLDLQRCVFCEQRFLLGVIKLICKEVTNFIES